MTAPTTTEKPIILTLDYENAACIMALVIMGVEMMENPQNLLLAATGQLSRKTSQAGVLFAAFANGVKTGEAFNLIELATNEQKQLKISAKCEELLTLARTIEKQLREGK